MARDRKLILASASPRRRKLLAALDLAFSCRPVDVDERPRHGEGAGDYVVRLARDKSNAAGASSREVVIAADTIVVLDGQLLGKPQDAAAARSMLAALSGRRHEVFTGVSVAAPPAPLVVDFSRTRVRIATLCNEEIDWYVATGEPLDKAGAYAIQGLGSLFVETVTGNYSNVVGLPLPLLYRLTRSLGFELRSFRNAEPRLSPRT